MGRLEEQVIIVTGGAHGIGRAYCEGLAREAARVVVADIDGRGAETVAETLSAGGQEALAVQVDVVAVDKTADRLRMHFYIPAARTAAHCASGTLDGLPECGHHVFPHLFDKFARERPTVGNDAVSLQSLNVGINAAEQTAKGATMQCHTKKPLQPWMQS